MKANSIKTLIAVTLLSVPNVNYGQTINLGTAVNYVLFSTGAAVTNSGIPQLTHLTGNVGSNLASAISGFGNVDGVMHDYDVSSGQCAADVLTAYGQLDTVTPTFYPGILLGNGDTLIAGVYSIPDAATMNLDLILNAQGNPNAVFIFQIQGAFSTSAASKVKLINGALACNVYWKVEGLVSMATATSMKGTIIAHNAAIHMTVNDTLEGRALSIAGAVTTDAILGYIPTGCGSVTLTGPAAPALASTACYAIFSSDGSVSNTGTTYATGDVGTNVGLTTGFIPMYISGTLHPIPDGSTAACAADLLNVYNYLNTLPYDIQLLYPAQFGSNLVLTPHTYLMNAATTLDDTVYLNAENDSDAVFVIQINGALTTSTYSKVILTNAAQAKNVYWNVNGAVNIYDYSVFNGTIVCNNSALSLRTGVTVNGRVLVKDGALATTAVTVTSFENCSSTTGITKPAGTATLLSVYPNPSTSSFYADLQSADNEPVTIVITNSVGQKVKEITTVTNRETEIKMQVASGVYFLSASTAHGRYTEKVVLGE